MMFIDAISLPSIGGEEYREADFIDKWQVFCETCTIEKVRAVELGFQRRLQRPSQYKNKELTLSCQKRK